MRCFVFVLRKALRDGVNEAAKTLKDSIRNKARTAATAETSKKRAAEAAVEEEERKKGKQAAEQVKEEEKIAKAIYRLDCEALQGAGGFTLVPMIDVATCPEPRDSDSPFVIMMVQKFQEWSKIAKVQMMLGTFGGSYKRKDAFKEHGRVQQMAVQKFGLEETTTFIDHLNGHLKKDELITPSTVQPVEQHLKCIWLFGNSPSLKHAALCPNCLGQWRVCAQGEIRYFLTAVTSFVAAMRLLTPEDQEFTPEKIVQEFENLDPDKLKKVSDNGCKVYTVVVKPNDALWVPVGWMVAEMSLKGVLLYGVRKTAQFHKSGWRPFIFSVSAFHCILIWFVYVCARGGSNRRQKPYFCEQTLFLSV